MYRRDWLLLFLYFTTIWPQIIALRQNIIASTTKLISIHLKLIDGLSKELGGVSNKLKSIGSQMTSVGAAMTAGITLPIVGAGVAMFKTFAEFETVMAELGARTGATAEEMKKMSAFALEMGRNTAFSATEAAQALLELTSSGSSAAEAMEMLPDVLNLAAAGALELGEAADAVTDILAQFQLGVEDAAMVTDVLAKAAGASSATVDDLIQGFANAGPVFAQFGISVEEAAAAMAVLAENGIKGAEAGTQLKSMLLNMTRDTETVSGAWQRLGVSMFDAQGNMRDIDAVFKDINAAMEGMSMEEQIRLSQDLAGSYGILGFNALRVANGTSEMQGQMLNQASAAEVAAAMNETLTAKFNNMIGSIEGIGIVMGYLSKGPLISLIETVTAAANAFSLWAETNPEMAQMVMILLAIVAAIGPILIFIGQLISAIVAIKTAILGFGAVAAAFSGFIALLLSPLGLFVAAVALAVAAILGNWFGLRDGLVSSVSAIVGVFSTIGDAMKSFGSAIAEGWKLMLDAAGTALSQLAQIVVTTLSRLGQIGLEIGKQIINGLIRGISQAILDLIKFVTDKANEISQAIRNAFGIASPSKVMEKMGNQVVEGFHKGIESMGGIGVNVPSATGGNSTQPSLGFAGAGVGSGGGGNVYIENLTVPPGTTEKQIDFIMKEIGKRSERRGAKKTK